MLQEEYDVADGCETTPLPGEATRLKGLQKMAETSGKTYTGHLKLFICHIDCIVTFHIFMSFCCSKINCKKKNQSCLINARVREVDSSFESSWLDEKGFT
jgi:hypothetical protein